MSTAKTPEKVAHIWSKDALLAKALRYAEEMQQHDRNDWKFGFWSSLTLELLARATLASFSPALLAERKDPADWHNLFFALGRSPKVKKFVPKSIAITDVFLRLGDIVPELDPRLVGFATQHMQRRNEELHSGLMPFEEVKSSNWLPLFYESLEVLLGVMHENLESLVSRREAVMAREMIKAAKDASAKAVEKSVHARRECWGQLEPRERTKLANQAALWAKKQSGHRVNCPACNSDALVLGSPLAAPITKLTKDSIMVTQQYLPNKFECIACGLKISGLPQLHASGLGSVYTSTSFFDPIEFYGGSDAYGAYEDDNNEP